MGQLITLGIAMKLLEEIDKVLSETRAHLMLGGRVIPDMLLKRGVITPTKNAYSESSARGKSWAWRVISDCEKAIQRLYMRNLEQASVSASAPARAEDGVICQVKLTKSWSDVSSALFSQLRGSKKVNVQKGAFEEFLSSMEAQEVFANEINQTVDPLKLINSKSGYGPLIAHLEGKLPYGLYNKLLDNEYEIGILSRRVYSSKGGLTLDAEIRIIPTRQR